MRALLTSITLNLRGLLRFSGVESRIEFWPYAGIVMLLTVAIYALGFLPMFLDTMQRMQDFALAHPEQATITQGPGSYSISIDGYHPELMPDFARLTPYIVAMVGGQIVLLAAAITRRLRDRGVTPWLAAPPLIFVCIALLLFPKIWAAFSAPQGPDGKTFGLFALLFANNLLYMGSLLALIIFLAGARPYASPSAETSQAV